MTKVVINLVTWNSLTYLPYCLDSIFKQDYNDFYLLVIDNGSSDGGLEFIERNYPEVKVLRNNHNLGYSKAHNQGILLTKSEYILVLNPDVILTPNFLSILVKTMNEHFSAASVGGKVLKFHFKPGELREIEFTDIIDSTGLVAFKNRRFADRGEGEEDKDQYNLEEGIFGISGAVALYRRKALNDIRYQDEYFDENFFIYKEDVDLAWRLRLRGWNSHYQPKAVAYHHREATGKISSDTKTIIKNRRKKSQFINYYSYKNHLLTIVKNEIIYNLFWWFPYIFYYELKKFLYILFFERSTLKSLVQFFGSLPQILQKRKYIIKNMKVKKNLIREWFK